MRKMKHCSFYLAIAAALLAGCSSPPSRPPVSFTPIAQPLTVMDVHNASIASARSLAKGGSSQLQAMGEQEFMNGSKKAITNQLKDPESAQFRGLRVVSYAGGAVVCGEVNAKNSYGGYGGFARFVANAAKGDIEGRGLGANGGIVEACGLS